jgi:hypothetical protein
MAMTYCDITFGACSNSVVMFFKECLFKKMTQNMCHLSGAGARDYKLMQDSAQFGRMDCFSMFFP